MHALLSKVTYFDPTILLVSQDQTHIQRRVWLRETTILHGRKPIPSHPFCNT